MADDKKGPWGSSSGSNNNPWDNGKGRRPSGGGYNGGSGGPDMDDMLRQAQNQFNDMFGHGGNKKIIGLLIIALILLWGATGFYKVDDKEDAVILTFGKWTKTETEGGLHYHLPWPIQTAEQVNITFERRIEIGFKGESQSSNGKTAKSNVKGIPSESLMVTGDENIIDINFVVQWNISDAKEYLYEIRNPEQTIKKVAESAMREVIGQTKIQEALTEKRVEVAQKTRSLMQDMLDSYSSGIAITAIKLQKIDPPETVIDAFHDVQRARADKERLRNEAEAYRNDIIPKARGEKERLLQEADGYKESVINKSTGDAKRFLSVYKSYASAKDITTKRIYIETMQDVLKNSNKIIIDSNKNGLGGVLPYLPLNQLQNKGK